MRDDTDLMAALRLLFDQHMHELRYNEPEYEREVLALMREIRAEEASATPQQLQRVVTRHQAAFEVKGEAEFSNRLEDFKKAIAPFVS